MLHFVKVNVLYIFIFLPDASNILLEQLGAETCAPVMYRGTPSRSGLGDIVEAALNICLWGLRTQLVLCIFVQLWIIFYVLCLN